LISKNYSKLDSLLFSGKILLIFSDELLEEFLEVSKRPKLRRFFSATDLEEILETIDEHADFVKVTSHVEACRDIKDNFLLSLAQDSNADFLLTGDKDLLDIEKFGKTKITTISAFLEM
jgi:putative PIN family toxin of toxin-antitoxin system